MLRLVLPKLLLVFAGGLGHRAAVVCACCSVAFCFLSPVLVRC
ncbi:hypothetical protein BVRB_7g165820 [Beta vulgaris subsp. vulgaris]|nr:hypothetical protein BVRB_7g165820 [Beta vulgaris subsp. vulgaris]